MKKDAPPAKKPAPSKKPAKKSVPQRDGLAKKMRAIAGRLR